MVIDCHMHLDPAMFTVERMLACMDANGIDKTALIPTMVEPFYLGGFAKVNAQRLLRNTLMSANGLGRLVYQSTVTGKGYFMLLGKKYRIYEKPDNAPVAEAVQAHPERFYGWIFVNPAKDPDPVAEIEKWSGIPGFIGIKAHPFWHAYDVSALEPVAAWCAEQGRPLLIHLGQKAGHGDYRVLPRKFPNLKVLYAHAGVPFFKALWAFAQEECNVYVDLSSPYVDAKVSRGALQALGAGKCIYGTDGPYGEQDPGQDYDYSTVKGRLEDMLSGGERDAVLAGNFAELIATG